MVKLQGGSKFKVREVAKQSSRQVDARRDLHNSFPPLIEIWHLSRINFFHIGRSNSQKKSRTALSREAKIILDPR
jgi:hypothetical protein